MAYIFEKLSISADSYTLKGLIERTLTEIEDDRVTAIGGNVFQGNKVIERISFPNAKSIGTYACYAASNLTHANLPKCETVGMYCFADANLSYFDSPVKQIYGVTFRNNANLRHLFLRRSDAICTLGDRNAFEGTPFVKTFGYAYVPRDLVFTYQSATNWSGLYAQWDAIEDYTVDGTITGEIDWKIIDGFTPFTIDGKRYYHNVETWEYWCDSEENTDGFDISADGYVISPDDKYVYDSNGNKQTGTGWISLDGEAYYTVKLITFTIDGVEYQAEDGMDWMQWVFSDYNTDGFGTAGSDVYNTAGEVVCDSNGVVWYLTPIESGGVYTTESR